MTMSNEKPYRRIERNGTQFEELIEKVLPRRCLENVCGEGRAIAIDDRERLYKALISGVLVAGKELEKARKRLEQLQDYYECKMETPQRVSNLEKKHKKFLKELAGMVNFKDQEQSLMNIAMTLRLTQETDWTPYIKW